MYSSGRVYMVERSALDMCWIYSMEMDTMCTVGNYLSDGFSDFIVIPLRWHSAAISIPGRTRREE